MAAGVQDDEGIWRMDAIVGFPVPLVTTSTGRTGGKLSEIIKMGEDHVLLIDIGPASRSALVIKSIGKTYDSIRRGCSCHMIKPGTRREGPRIGYAAAPFSSGVPAAIGPEMLEISYPVDFVGFYSNGKGSNRRPRARVRPKNHGPLEKEKFLALRTRCCEVGSLPGWNRPGLIEAIAPHPAPSMTACLPGWNRPGLIEANITLPDFAIPSEVFRGGTAPASLKHVLVAGGDGCRCGVFRGGTAPASLKPAGQAIPGGTNR